MDDVSRLKRALRPVEQTASKLPWADKRPWRIDTHIGLDAGVPTIDLHDLGRKTALDAVDLALDAAPDLQTGALFFVVGRGRHSVGGPVLPGAVGQRLRQRCTERQWTVRTPRAGRFAVVTDRARAPSSATGALGWGFWLWVAIVLGAAALAVARSCS